MTVTVKWRCRRGIRPEKNMIGLHSMK